MTTIEAVKTLNDMRAKYKLKARKRRLWLADYHLMVDFGQNLDQIAVSLKYKETRQLVYRLENLEEAGYQVRWPEFPVPTYDDAQLMWWRSKLQGSSQRIFPDHSGSVRPLKYSSGQRG
ncbi:hypothetical protein R2362_03310 [Mycobacteroides chelonae]|nr:hypothetical protein [Mycobacteroides chelonae]